MTCNWRQFASESAEKNSKEFRESKVVFMLRQGLSLLLIAMFIEASITVHRVSIEVLFLVALLEDNILMQKRSGTDYSSLPRK